MTGIAMYRYAPPIGLAAAATVDLLLLMQALIRVDELHVQDPVLSPPIEFVPVIEERPPEVPPRTPPPPLPELPPEVVFTEPTVTGTGDSIWTGPRQVVPPSVSPTRVGTSMITPIVEPAPIYPRRCAARGLEGYVLVRYDVNEIGAPMNVEVVDAQPPGCFERAAVSSVARYRYRPAVSNGEPMVMRGMQKQITFRLDG